MESKTTNLRPLVGNVIDKSLVRQRILDITRYVADVVGRTLGPYGHGTLIQNLDRITATKDGWHTQQKIKFDNALDNALKSMQESSAFSAVLQAGDGTSTVTIFSHWLAKYILDIDNLGVFTTKEIETELNWCIEQVIGKIQENAVKITEENLEEAIYNVAMVATNWDESLSGMIRDIYKETNNSIIRVEEGKSTETYYEIVHGYDLMGELMCPDFYVTNTKKNCYEAKNPLLMMFDYKIPDKYFYHLYYIGLIAEQHLHKPLVILAPDYELSFINHVKSFNMDAAKRGVPYVSFVPAQFHKNVLVDEECMNDFAVLTGGIIITRNNNEVIDFMDNVYTVMSSTVQGLKKEEAMELKARKEELIKRAPKYLTESVCGTCGKIVINNKGTTISELTGRNEKAYNERVEMLETEIEQIITTAHAKTTLTSKLRQKRIRLGKLRCVMGVIYLSGHGEANTNIRRDSLDDAIRACEAAFRGGYTVGSTVAIGNAVLEVAVDVNELSIIAGDDGEPVKSKAYYPLFRVFSADNLTDIKPGDRKPALQNMILYAIYESAYNVFLQIFKNKCDIGPDVQDFTYVASDTHSALVSNLYRTATEENVALDIITNKWDTEKKIVINPVDVDTEVLIGSLRLVSNVFVSDQLLFESFDGDDSILEMKTSNPTTNTKENEQETVMDAIETITIKKRQVGESYNTNVEG